MRDHFYMAVGDTAPVFLIRLKPGPVDLTGATGTYTIQNRKTKAHLFTPPRGVNIASGTYDVGAENITVTPQDGYVVITLQSGDTVASGEFGIRIRITFPGGRIASYPNYSLTPLTISD